VSPIAWLAYGLIRLYQLTLSPWLPSSCRFEPSCSQFGLDAVRRYGALRGGWMTVKRIVRCRPGVAGGYDPVPYPPDHADDSVAVHDDHGEGETPSQDA